MFLPTFPPIWAYTLAPKYPLIGEVAAYTKIAVDKREPRSVYSSPKIVNKMTTKVTTRS